MKKIPIIESQQVPFSTRITTLMLSSKLIQTLLTEKKNLKLLNINQAKLERIFALAPEGLALLLDSKLIEVNDKFTELTGYTHKELVTNNVEVIFELQPQINTNNLFKYFANHKHNTLRIETKLKHKSKNFTDVILSATPINNQDMNLGILIAVTDISQRKEIENIILKQNHRYESLNNELQMTNDALVKANLEAKK